MKQLEFLVLLSGTMAVGKTTLREQLVLKHGFDYVRSGRYLLDMAEREALDGSRRGLQDLGDELDRKTDFLWLLLDVAIPGFQASPDRTRWLVDAVRKPRQVKHFRDAFGPTVLHVHLTAPDEVLKARYESRRFAMGEGADPMPYEIAIAHDNEVASRGLISIADLVIGMNTVTPEDAATRVLETGRDSVRS